MPAVNEVLARLSDLLVQERALLISGRASEVVALSEDKLALMKELEEALSAQSNRGGLHAIAPAVDAVKALASENAAHFEAVRNGLRSAAARLGSLGSEALVGSYGEGGRRMEFTGAAGGYFKRV